MACRVGITTDPEERKRHWQRQHPNLYNWEILGTHSTKAAAQAHENHAARASRCVSAPGGADADGVWSVYRFYY